MPFRRKPHSFIILLSVFALSTVTNPVSAKSETKAAQTSKMKFAEVCMDKGGTWVGSFEEGHCDHKAKKQLAVAKKCIEEGRTWHGSFEKGRCGN